MKSMLWGAISVLTATVACGGNGNSTDEVKNAPETYNYHRNSSAQPKHEMNSKKADMMGDTNTNRQVCGKENDIKVCEGSTTGRENEECWRNKTINIGNDEAKEIIALAVNEILRKYCIYSQKNGGDDSGIFRNSEEREKMARYRPHPLDVIGGYLNRTKQGQSAIFANVAKETVSEDEERGNTLDETVWLTKQEKIGKGPKICSEPIDIISWHLGEMDMSNLSEGTAFNALRFVLKFSRTIGARRVIVLSIAWSEFYLNSFSEKDSRRKWSSTTMLNGLPVEEFHFFKESGGRWEIIGDYYNLFGTEQSDKRKRCEDTVGRLYR